MTKNYRLDSNDIRNIERFENKYYNQKKMVQNGGSTDTNKLNKNIQRLYNCYILLQNQNGGADNELSLQIKKRLNKKITELNELEGGTIQALSKILSDLNIFKNDLSRLFDNNKTIDVNKLHDYIRSTSNNMNLNTYLFNAISSNTNKKSYTEDELKQLIDSFDINKSLTNTDNFLNQTGDFLQKNLNPWKWGK